ncbi:MAG: TonB-dependent receptor [Anaerolineae bacterium]|nr:TonB-dependent receptor [Anaerolineae bacterium]
MSKFNELSGAIRIALMAGTFTLMAAPVMAQDADDDDATELTTVTVTGTRIQSQTITAASPVTEVSREDFKYTGTTRVEDLLNTFPQLAPSFDAFTVNPTTGFATANLRNLGTNRTLVLVNGQRLQPGGIRSEAPDLNQIPAALVQRVDVLTGGASAVYGSDAVAGVINFVLDTEFEGLSINAGYSAYQHNNDNAYIQGRLDARGFDYPTGSSGLDGDSRNIDIAIGSRFGDDAGHAMAWLTYRKNDELRQEARDYSSCALNNAGTTCGGSATAPVANFFLVSADGTLDFDLASPNSSGTWVPGLTGLYNYAPVNHFQRPDERYTFGSSIKYEVNRYFRPFIETMFTNTNTSVQIAESGTFFNNLLNFDCSDPLIGSLCSDLGVTPGAELTPEYIALGGTNDVVVYVGKRNIEGGPRISNIESNSFRFVTGAEGDINDSWTYNFSILYGRNSSNEESVNDFLTDRVGQALLACPPGSFNGCIPYDVWSGPGNVTAAAAAALAGTGIRTGTTEVTSVNAYASGDLGFGFPSAKENISLVVGAEWRESTFAVNTDSNWQSGNFIGAGGPRLPRSGDTQVTEFFFEAAVPLVADAGPLKALNLDLGYRYSDYDRSGGENTYKIGMVADFGMVRVRGGYNRAIRAPNVTELFSPSQIALFGGGDGCAGSAPLYTPEQCANTGVSASQYGQIPDSPASQYNQFIAGNINLQPEQADTYTLGLVISPIQDLSFSIDYYDIGIEDTINTIGAQTILDFCATLGDEFLCSLVRRRPGSGDIWLGSNPTTSGQIVNPLDNFGTLDFRGLDITGNYRMDLWGGSLTASFVASRTLEAKTDTLPGFGVEVDCAGVINPVCTAPATPDWRSTATLRFSKDFYTASLRWRYVGSLDNINTDGSTYTTDTLLAANGGIDDYNYLDLSGSFDLTQTLNLTVGVNNVFDREPPLVGAQIALNANAPNGYDQLGRYFFTNLTFTY